MVGLFAASLFVAGYVVIAMEHRLFVNKAAVSLVLATALWVLVGLAVPASALQRVLVEAGSDIFGLVIFLLTAMTLVEILLHYHLFDVIELWLRRRGWTYYRLGWAMAGLVFVFSGIIDNLTTTIVAMQISRRLFPKKYIISMGALIVIAANAGGAFSPIGDVTTLMLWFAGKFSAAQIIAQGFFPSLVLLVIAAVLLLRRMPHVVCDSSCDTNDFQPSRSDRAIIFATFISFFLPVFATLFGLPPYMGLLAGLGGVWLLIDVAKKARPQETHLQANIRHFFQQTDIESIQFFVGILLAVSALHALGILHTATDFLLGAEPSYARLISVFSGLGVGSAIVDNVPLTAAAISALDGVSTSLWVLLAIAVGTGGSLLIIGSAAGIIAMGMVPEITFGKYLRIGTVPALLGYVGAVATWLLQHWIFF